MAIRQIRQKGDEILSKKCKNVDIIDDKIKILVEDMLDTMYYYDGIGLAASQVGVLKNIIVYDVNYIKSEKAERKPVICINPKIISASKAMLKVEEGCLSFPNEFEYVLRCEKVKLEYTDLNGCKKVVNTKDMESVVIQHETDHLDGIVFLDRKEKE